MSAFLDGIGSLIGKVTQWIPGRIEALKNERERLINEKKFLESREFSASGSRRIIAINDRLRQIDQVLINSAKD